MQNTTRNRQETTSYANSRRSSIRCGFVNAARISGRDSRRWRQQRAGTAVGEWAVDRLTPTTAEKTLTSPAADMTHCLTVDQGDFTRHGGSNDQLDPKGRARLHECGSPDADRRRAL